MRLSRRESLCPVHHVERLDGICVPCDFGFPPEGAPHDPATCVNGMLGYCQDLACLPCEIVFDFSRRTHHCETHNVDVEQDDIKEPRKCEKGWAA